MYNALAYLLLLWIQCEPLSSAHVRPVFIHDIVRSLGTAIIARSPIPWSMLQYCLIDMSVYNHWKFICLSVWVDQVARSHIETCILVWGSRHPEVWITPYVDIPLDLTRMKIPPPQFFLQTFPWTIPLPAKFLHEMSSLWYVFPGKLFPEHSPDYYSVHRHPAPIGWKCFC